MGSSGLEPPTSRLSVACSSQLSYEPVSFFTLGLWSSSIFFACLTSSVRLVEMMGFEPMTPCLQGRCSPSWATPPFRVHSLRSFASIPKNWTTIESVRNLALCFWVFLSVKPFSTVYTLLNVPVCANHVSDQRFSIERRWSSRTFRYGYLVTT